MRTIYTPEEWEVLKKKGKTSVDVYGQTSVCDKDGNWHPVRVQSKSLGRVLVSPKIRKGER